MTALLSLDRPLVAVNSDIDVAVSVARQHGEPVLFTRTELLPLRPDSLAFLAASSDALGGGILWHQSQTGISLSGAGSAIDISCDGPSRFGETSAAVRKMAASILRGDGDQETPFPIIGGFAFSGAKNGSTVWRGFPGSRMVIPRVLLQCDRETALIRVTLPVEPHDTPFHIAHDMDDLFGAARRWAQAAMTVPAEPVYLTRQSLPARRTWESSVATAVGLIRQEMLDKVVLAREERLRANSPISPVSILEQLRSFDRDATIYAMQSGQDWFLGASPERLVRLNKGRVDVTCLAGSIDIGQNAEDQARLAERLLASEKDREEHEIVVRSTMDALAEVCDEVTRLSGTPRVVTARAVQHLETPVSGTLSSAGHVLDLVERLHPTPAVGGHPQDVALRVIKELENFDRGWYAGPFGWTDLDGSGEFAVAIRSALLSGNTASLFAGCGIVEDSVPAAEYDETCLKLRPMLAALGAL
ncbi:MAG: isochorismate synthase [Chloroflexota bacterium]|nr:isochorismate synthase [Chloroflexota bacterium]